MVDVVNIATCEFGYDDGVSVAEEFDLYSVEG